MAKKSTAFSGEDKSPSAAALLRHMVNAASDGLVVTDAEGKPIECNTAFLEMAQWPAEWKTQPPNVLWFSFAARLESPALLVSVQDPRAAVTAERSVSLRFTDGRELVGGGQPCRLDQDRIGWLWRFRDLSSFDQSELAQEREWFRVTLSSIGDAVITTDIEAQVTYLNPIAEKMTGWTKAEARGQPLTRVFHIVNELTGAAAVNPVTRVLAEGVIIGLANHTALIDRQGNETAIEDSAAPIRDATGNIVGAVMVFHDVDARRKAERALHRSEQLLSDFFANAPVGLNWISADGLILRVNRAELRMLGCKEGDYLGKPWEDFHENAEVARDILCTLVNGGSVENQAARMRHRDGSLRDVLISASAFIEDGHFVHARCFSRDVTEHNRAEAAQAHLAALVASSDDAIVSKNLSGIVQSWNAGAQRLFGYSAAEAIGQPITLVIPPDRLDEEPAILERLKRGERVDHFETIRRRKDGTLVDVSLTISPVLNAEGKIIGASKIARNIGEHRQVLNALREEHAITDELNKVAQALVQELDLNRIVQVITDAGTRITRAQFGAFFYNQVNDQGESYMLYALSGVDRSKFEKFPMPRATDLFGPTFRGEGVIRLADVRQDPRFGRNAPHHGMPAGHLPVVSYLAVPVLGHAGDVIGGLFFGHAKPGVFTERDEKIIVGVAAQASVAMNTAHLYEAEKKARATAESSNEAKDRFIATLSHELRTPLTPVIAILSSLRENPDLPASMAEDVETARRNILLEARLIDDLLDLTRIARGKLTLEEEVIQVEGLLENALNICRPDLEGRELEIVRDLRAPFATVKGDRARLTQVLWNLLKNAIKFTPDGGTITLRSRVPSAGNAAEVVIQVQDTGVGIDAEILPRIFSAFDQGGQETTRRFGGLGLGLAISQAIVQAHHGKLEAASPGRKHGSLFTVTLPLADRETATRPGSGNPIQDATSKDGGTAPLRILLVEDHADTANILARLLTTWGHTVFHRTTVAEARKAAEKEMAADGLDLVISDLGLPDGSGLDLMKELAKKYSLKGIALSGYGMESDLKQSAAVGFAKHLIKPVDLNMLRTAIQDITADR
jgi:PAS domain S-box-containing protein